jgi:transposase
MQEITTIGLDLAKTVFQVHAVSADGSAVLKRKLRRSDFGPFPPSWASVWSA